MDEPLAKDSLAKGASGFSIRLYLRERRPLVNETLSLNPKDGW